MRYATVLSGLILDSHLESVGLSADAARKSVSMGLRPIQGDENGGQHSGIRNARRASLEAGGTDEVVHALEMSRP
jgi:hypothetical protein